MTENLMSRQSCLKLCRNRIYILHRNRDLHDMSFICCDIVFYVVKVRHCIGSRQGWAHAAEALCRDSHCIASRQG